MRLDTSWRVIAIAATVLLTTTLCAPATWLAKQVAQHSRMRLIYTSGTIWNGDAMLAVSDGRKARLMPGRISWRVQWPELLRGRMSLTVRHPSIDGAFRVSYGSGALNVEAGRALLPAGMLEVLGAPFNTISPGGTLRIGWDALQFANSGVDGEVRVEWLEAQSALSPVVPLGDFRVVAQASSGQGDLKLTTLNGPLLLEGAGRLEGGTFRFSGTADTVPEMRASLNGLIGVLGPRSGQKVLLKWELQA